MQFLKSLFVPLFLTVVALGGLYYFLGVTTITATDEGKPVAAKVYVNDEYVGETPLQTRLGPGTFTIKVAPPPAYRAKDGDWQVFSLVVGMAIHQEVTPFRYRVTLYAPGDTSAEFEVVSAKNKAIGTCDGKICEIPLPGPGDYRARMKLCSTTTCTLGNSPFTLAAGQEVASVSWQ